MELKEYMRLELEGLDRQLKRVTDGLKQEEICWLKTRNARAAWD